MRGHCGSTGYVMRILAQRRGRWVIACETYADDGVGPVLDDAQSAGWRNLRGTYRLTWRADAARPAGVACVEGEAVPRPEQGRVARRRP